MHKLAGVGSVFQRFVGQPLAAAGRAVVPSRVRLPAAELLRSPNARRLLAGGAATTLGLWGAGHAFGPSTTSPAPTPAEPPPDAAAPEAPPATDPGSQFQAAVDHTKTQVQEGLQTLSPYAPYLALGGLALGGAGLANRVMRRRRKTAALEQWPSPEETAAQHPFCAGFLVKCAELGLTEEETLDRIEASCRVPAIAAEWSAFRKEGADVSQPLLDPKALTPPATKSPFNPGSPLAQQGRLQGLNPNVLNPGHNRSWSDFLWQTPGRALGWIKEPVIPSVSERTAPPGPDGVRRAQPAYTLNKNPQPVSGSQASLGLDRYQDGRPKNPFMAPDEALPRLEQPVDPRTGQVYQPEFVSRPRTWANLPARVGLTAMDMSRQLGTGMLGVNDAVNIPRNVAALLGSDSARARINMGLRDAAAPLNAATGWNVGAGLPTDARSQLSNPGLFPDAAQTGRGYYSQTTDPQTGQLRPSALGLRQQDLGINLADHKTPLVQRGVNYAQAFGTGLQQALPDMVVPTLATMGSGPAVQGLGQLASKVPGLGPLLQSVMPAITSRVPAALSASRSLAPLATSQGLYTGVSGAAGMAQQLSGDPGTPQGLQNAISPRRESLLQTHSDTLLGSMQQFPDNGTLESERFYSTLEQQVQQRSGVLQTVLTDPQLRQNPQLVQQLEQSVGQTLAPQNLQWAEQTIAADPASRSARVAKQLVGQATAVKAALADPQTARSLLQQVQDNAAAGAGDVGHPGPAANSDAALAAAGGDAAAAGLPQNGPEGPGTTGPTPGPAGAGSPGQGSGLMGMASGFMSGLNTMQMLALGLGLGTGAMGLFSYFGDEDGDTSSLIMGALAAAAGLGVSGIAPGLFGGWRGAANNPYAAAAGAPPEAQPAANPAMAPGPAIDPAAPPAAGAAAPPTVGPPEAPAPFSRATLADPVKAQAFARSFSAMSPVQRLQIIKPHLGADPQTLGQLQTLAAMDNPLTRGYAQDLLAESLQQKLGPMDPASLKMLAEAGLPVIPLYLKGLQQR